MTATISGDTGIDLIQDGAVATADIANGVVTPAKLSQPLTLGTAQATTSGTSIDFTGIPSWVKRITAMFNGVSTSGISRPIIQLGSGSIQSTGYVSASGRTNSANNAACVSETIGMVMLCDNATFALRGAITLLHMGGNLWAASGVLTDAVGLVVISVGGNVTLAGVLDRIRLTTVNGTDTFDAGSVNILYEG